MSPASDPNNPADNEPGGPAAEDVAAPEKAATEKAPKAKAAADKADKAEDKPGAGKAAGAKAAAAKAGADTTAEDEAGADEAGEDEAAKPAAKAAAAKPAAKAAAAKAPAAKAGARAAGAKAAAAKAPVRAAKPKAEVPSRLVTTDLPADIFDAKVNVPLIHQVVVAQQAAARQGTHSTKTRGDVRGGGKKPYRQKGTGRARQGSTRAPQFAGGGVVHGPHPRSYDQKTPKKMKAAALRGALSDRARHGLVQVVEGFVDDEPRTQQALAVLSVATGTAPGKSAVLVVVESSDKTTWKSLRNAQGVHLIDPGQLNTYDVLVSDRVVFTRAAFDSFVARAGRQKEQER
jgi:large subunit ribosomal protein L4